MGKRSFGTVLDGIVSVVLASAASAGGCGGATTSSGTASGGVADGGTGIGFDDEATFTCVPPLAAVLSNLTPALAVDYVELRSQTFANPSAPRPPGEAPDGGVDAGTPPVHLTTLATYGAACATATKRDTCLGSLAAVKIAALADGWQPHSGGGKQAIPETLEPTFIVYTRGDEVGVLHSTAELAAFLAPIDTLEEARLLLLSQGYTFACVEQPKTGWKQTFDGSWDLIVVGDICDGTRRYRYRIGSDGTVTRVGVEKSDDGIQCGRRPEGLVQHDAGGAAIGLGAYFAEVAHLEAASVVAFERLARELARLGAPDSLVQRARRARADEIRHARRTASLAHRFGEVVRSIEVTPMITRDLLAVAVENAVEGCVRETYGALVAAFQARTARDPDVRAVLAGIARDEARHAELSHDVARWLETRLDGPSRRRVAAERSRALEELRGAIDRAPAADVVREAGMPDVMTARALLDGLTHAVLAA